MSIELSHIKNGETVKVLKINESLLKVKLIEMGFVIDKNLKVLYRAPFGDPIAVQIDGYVLSLRKSEANLIFVERLKNNDL